MRNFRSHQAIWTMLLQIWVIHINQHMHLSIQNSWQTLVQGEFEFQIWQQKTNINK